LRPCRRPSRAGRQHFVECRCGQDGERNLLQLLATAAAHALYRDFAQLAEALLELGEQDLNGSLGCALLQTLFETLFKALFEAALDQLFGRGHVIRLHRRFDLLEGKAQSLGLIIADRRRVRD
jgi:hypothetical protein